MSFERDVMSFRRSVGRDVPIPKRVSRQPLTVDDVGPLMEAVGPVIRAFVAKELAPLRAKIEALEKRAAVKYSGVFKQGASYAEANICTHDGGLWLARADTASRPGTDASWQLIVKSHR